MRTHRRHARPGGVWLAHLLLICCAMRIGDVQRGMTAEPEPARKSSKPLREKEADPSALDDALLKDLDNELLDEAGDLKKRAKKPAPGKRGENRPPDKNRPDVDGEDVGMPGAEDDPLLHISDEMRSVEGLIPERSRRVHAEVLQKRIVEDLAKLIEQAERQRAAQKSSSSKNKKQQSAKRQSVQPPKTSAAGTPGKESNKPAKDSTDRLGRAEEARPDAELVKGLMKDTWGHLPERAREQMLQNSPEKFLPQYELLIERYYKRLAEERNAR